MRTEGLSINLATVRQQWNLVEAVEACARHGITCVDPRRDQVATVGLDVAVKAIKDNGMRVSGYCRGGMFLPPMPPGARRRSTTTSARLMRRPRSAPNVWCWWSAGCRQDHATSPPRARW